MNGKVNSSSWVNLSDNVTVDGKIDSSSKVVLRNGVLVKGKVDASGAIEIDGGEHGVMVEGKVNSSTYLILTARASLPCTQYLSITRALK